MGQVLIRNLDDDLLADYREAAERNRRSLEAELRDALRVARPVSSRRKDELVEISRRIRAMTPKGVRQTPAELLVREDRDGYRDA
jgi:plasmid stability protein